jgi:hypothetical protein
MRPISFRGRGPLLQVFSDDHRDFGELHQENWISLIPFSNWKNSRCPT